MTRQCPRSLIAAAKNNKLGFVGKKDQQDEYDPELARWLQDSGRRRAIRLKESPEELLSYAEQLAGVTLSGREDIREYFEKVRREEAERLRSIEKRRVLREAVLVVLLGFAIAQYYFWDVQLQVLSAQKNYYFVRASSKGS